MESTESADEFNRHIVDCLSDPYRCQLFVEILRGTCSKASELHNRCPNIPRATMYRHLKRLTDDGLIEVVDEVKKRGTVERTYAPVKRVFDNMESVIQSNPSEMYFSMFMQYVLSFVQQFREFCDDSDADLTHDAGFSMSPILATNEEINSALREIADIIGRLRENEPAEGRRFHTIGLILSPPHS